MMRLTEEMVISVTTIQLPSVRVLLWCRFKAIGVTAQTKLKAPGLLWSRTWCEFSTRRLISVSLWRDARSVAQMGEVSQHIDAAHYAARKKLRTASAIFRYQGHWAEVVHGLTRPSHTPSSTSQGDA